MDGSRTRALFSLSSAALDRLMPMHICLSGDGLVTSAGPTVVKSAGDVVLPGAAFFDLFQIRRPGGIATMPDLLRQAGMRLYLNLRDHAAPGFRGIAMPLADGGALVNLSFGITLADAVREHRLTDADFAATDLAVELLYLVEAKTAVMDELRDLNLRLQGAKSAAEEQALTDTLTGLRNRRAMDGVLADLVARGQNFGVMHVDLDFFKQVNDSLGHAAGDFVLQHVAHVLNTETRSGDTVARVGGDEFVILFPTLLSLERMRTIAARIIDRLSQPIPYQGETCRISASIGINLSSAYDPPEPDRILSDADRATYASKHAGRGRATVYDPGDHGGANGDTAGFPAAR